MKPQLEVLPDGSTLWKLNGKLHREDGPAVKRPNGVTAWWVNGQLHREDGPALEGPNGAKYWYLNDEKLFEEDLLSETMQINYPKLYNSYLISHVMES